MANLFSLKTREEVEQALRAILARPDCDHLDCRTNMSSRPSRSYLKAEKGLAAVWYLKRKLMLFDASSAGMNSDGDMLHNPL